MKSWQYSLRKIAYIILFLISCVIIILLVVECYPIRTNFTKEKVERANDIVLALSCSYVCSCIFYLLQDRLPNQHKRMADKIYVEYKLKQVHSILKREVYLPSFWSNWDNHVPSIEEFVKGFDENYLFATCDGGKLRYSNFLMEYKEINSIVTELLKHYGSVLTYTQLRKLEYLKDNLIVVSLDTHTLLGSDDVVKYKSEFLKKQAVIIYKSYLVMDNSKFKVPKITQLEKDIDNDILGSID